MNRAFSVYLDLIRFGAACLVYLYHSNQRWLVTEKLPLSNFGHSAVIVFFVLSGFVIAYVTATKENEWVTYTASRLSRVYSVVVPTLLVTVALDSIGRQLQPEVYTYPYDHFALRIIGSLLMLNEVWFISITTFSNVPYWSVTYEFWYYAAFGLILFLPGRVALPTALGLLLLIGPKLLLLAPIWYAGVLLYRWQTLKTMSKPLAWLLTVASTAAIIGLHASGVLEKISAGFEARVGAEAFKALTFSKFFIADYFLCALVFCHFAGVRRLAADLHAGLGWVEGPIRWLAGFTFTLYLLHQPLFMFWGSVLRGDPGSLLPWLLVTGLTLCSVMLIGHYTESKRGILKQTLTQWLRLRSRSWVKA